MRAVQVTKAGGPFEIVERNVPEPGQGQVRLKVQACGVCHSDSLTKEGYFPGIQYPRIPGHEVAGIIDAIGPNVGGWKVGQRAGVGWHGGHCGYCDSCRRGEFVTCQVDRRVSGIHIDGGYADYMIAHAGTLALIPDSLAAEQAAPLMCAGVTTYNSMRNSGARAGDLVAVHGVGGLGHLAVQFAAKMGYRTVAIARGADKAAYVKALGAHHYIDTQTQDAAAELMKLGGAKVIVATVTDAKAMSSTVTGLATNGKLIVLGAPADMMEVSALALLGERRSIMGWPSGSSIDSQDTLAFAALAGVQSKNEVFTLDRAAEAYDRMMSGRARFRVVITTGM